MGILLDANAISFLQNEFGGHPLLTRIVCSKIHQYINFKDIQRPFSVDVDIVKTVIRSANAEIESYCTHIISELKKFYRDEYDSLEMLACGLVSDFDDLVESSYFVGHLTSYGSVAIGSDRKPDIQFPVLKRYLKTQNERKLNHVVGRFVIEVDKREFWLRSTIRRILDDFRELSSAAKKDNKPNIYMSMSVPDADMLSNNSVVSNEGEFRSFVSTCYQVFVENIVNHDGPSYYNTNFKVNYPYIRSAFHRIKCYRHWQNHLKIDDHKISDDIDAFLSSDIDGRIADINDSDWFLLQQIVLDELHGALQWEIASISR
ncbi:MAG: hypothetical protein Q8R85_18840 [Bosea sp. (in: a-proteobacteria)]|uniref:hypothetical protein n=1 Tax=Bosea sp. (in: a-proteobacteria) TaxID=1871050 RepID=UPI002732645A|nr:hypothetical protein [Bosea sp. (in: a-proteobacteria)]MDP3603224.1 hypothetical protein [Bosea sp. (in: a-proteobacteria)]